MKLEIFPLANVRESHRFLCSESWAAAFCAMQNVWVGRRENGLAPAPYPAACQFWRHMLWRVWADCSQLTQFLEQQGIGQSTVGCQVTVCLLDCSRVSTNLLIPCYGVNCSVTSHRSKGLKETVLQLTSGCGRFARLFACLLIVLQVCKQCYVCHSDSNLCVSAERSLEDVISFGEVCLPTSVDSAQGCCTRGCAIFSSKNPANQNKWIKGVISHGFPIAISFKEHWLIAASQQIKISHKMKWNSEAFTDQLSFSHLLWPLLKAWHASLA